MNDDLAPTLHDMPYLLDGINWHEDTVLSFAKGITVGYGVGVRDERERIASGTSELSSAWKPIGERGHAARVAERIAIFERHAAENEAATWRGRYPGGPVDYDSGELINDHIGAAA